MFREAYRAMVLKDLLCPACGAMNIPNAKPTIDLDQTQTRAQCSTCGCERLLEHFHPKDRTR